MSGDVQPRKRKDKKKKKDEFGVEEPRGTAAALGDGDVFIHSQQDHGTGGHWCAKIIFFSLLAVLVTLIGLIILENRGLSELEAKAVQSQYSGVLEGWLEDAPDDDHHDEHTLDLKHHDDDDGDEEHNVEESDHEDEEDHESDNEDEEDHDEDESDHEDEEDDENFESREEEEDQEESVEDQTEADEDDDENIPSNEVDSNEEQDADNDDDQSEDNLQDNEDGEGEIRYKRYYYGEKYDDDEDNDEYEQNFEDDQDDEEDAKQDHDEDDENDENDQSDEDDQNDKNYHSDEDAQNDDEDAQNDDEDAQNDDEDAQNDDEDDQNDEEDDNNEENYGNYPNADDNDQNFQYDLDDDNTEIINQDTNGNNDDSYEQKDEQDNEEDQEQEDEIEEDADDEEIEKIEKEVVDDDTDSDEAAGNRDADDDDFYASREDADREAGDDEDALEEQDVDDDEPPLERITAPPAGKPFVEIEEEVTEKPVNTLAEEEEYERRQEQLRKEQEEEAAQGSQTWVKLAVGGALLVATHAVLRRATAGPRDVPEPEEHVREETPTVDRRMTLIPEQHSPRVQQESPVTKITPEIEEEIFKKPAPISKSAPIVKQDSKEEVIVKKTPVEEKTAVVDTKDADKELYSEEEEEDEEYEEEEDIEEPVKEVVQKKAPPVPETKPTEESEPEDVEIIDDEQIEEELEDEEDEDEEEISDVDDTELLSRLEAKYGRIPEPERYGSKPERFGPIHKDGGNSIEDDWPGEPSDAYWRTELNIAEEELRQGAWSACEERASAAALAGSARARYLAARALDHAAEAQRDNRLLGRAIAAYLHLLKMNERLSDRRLLEVAHRAIDRIQFRGTYLNAEPIYRLLIRRFPDDVNFRNNLTVSFLMANRPDLADEVLKETLRLWPDDRVALAHHGFVLKNQYNKLEEAVDVLYKALEGDTGPANEPRFYYHLGDALLLLGRFEEAHEVHKRGAALGHFLSPAQRSLYNVPRLKSKPWWSVEETPYVNLARALERSWREILKEGEAAKALYEKEKEGLKERGEWSQLDLFVRGAELPGRCARAPVTCAIVRGEAAAAGCRRGQVKFSLMAAGTHVRPHVGPTNCRLRMHLGLSNTKDTYIRVDKETRQWQTGKTFIFDDSFEHEVWHNGTGARLVLIVDVWHPELSARERRALPAI